MKEMWKDIPNYIGYYQASTYGRIKSLARTIMRSNGRIQTFKERILKPWIDKGYFLIVLYKKGESKHFKIHRLVLSAFKGKSNLECNHIDCNKLNNKLENLEYCTCKENIQHARKNGLYKDEKKIKQFTKKGVFIKTRISASEVGRKLEINNSHISACCRGTRKTAGGFKWSLA